MKLKAVTLADIAGELGISKNAVSLALRGKDGVSEELRERVRMKAQEMKYLGVNKVQGCILALIPQRIARAAGTFYQRLCFDMEAYAAGFGYQLIISSVSSEDEALCRPPALLGSVACTGIITVGNLSPGYCRMIYSLGTRYVMADQFYDDIPVSSVVTANSSASYMLTRKLIDCGHRSIQFFGSSQRTSSLEERWIGYKRAMRDRQLPILNNRLSDGSANESQRLIAQALRELPELPTAFVCGHDVIALDLIEALQKRGLRCPDDFSVVGFDDVQTHEVQALNLTTYRTPYSAIAKTAIELLYADEAPKRIQLFGEVVERSSIRSLR
ncbi:MAG: LacI family DNA-binding transcriptional regulator [Clostridia bacterium]|nr:LacI family DNA-binding transcriptional regulator [Clostridia bacterium]